MKKENKTKIVNYICLVFRIATQTFNGAIRWETFETMCKPENVVVSLWKILSKCHKEIICPEQFNPARRFAERLKWKLLETLITFLFRQDLVSPSRKVQPLSKQYKLNMQGGKIACPIGCFSQRSISNVV